jgi:hypothetical protein
LGDEVKDLFIANMDPDDNIDDILRLDRSLVTGRLTFTWRRSKNGAEPWREWRHYAFNFPTVLGAPSPEVALSVAGFAGRFGAAPGGGTMVIDPNRKGHFFSEAKKQVGAPPDWESQFPY